MMSLIRLLSVIDIDKEVSLAVEDQTGLHPAVRDSNGKAYQGLGGSVYTQRSFDRNILQRYLYREIREVTTRQINGAETLTIILY